MQGFLVGGKVEIVKEVRTSIFMTGAIEIKFRL